MLQHLATGMLARVIWKGAHEPVAEATVMDQVPADGATALAVKLVDGLKLRDGVKVKVLVHLRLRLLRVAMRVPDDSVR